MGKEKINTNKRDISKNFSNYCGDDNQFFLLYCAINPPAYFPFLKDAINRIIYGVVSVFLSFKALKMFFTKENKS